MSTRRFRPFRSTDPEFAAAPWLPELVEATQPRLTAIARRIAGPSSADDVVQTVYLSLARRGPDLSSVPVWAWLVTAVVRTAYRRRGADRRLRSGLEADQAPVEVEAVPERLSRAETDAGVRAAIAGLPPIYRDAVLLHHIEGLRLRVVAELLAVPTQTVKTRLRRARLLLRTRLETRRRRSPFLFAPLGSLLGRGTPLLGAPMSIKPLVLAFSALVVAGAAAFLTLDPDEPAPRQEIAHTGEPPKEVQDDAREVPDATPELRAAPERMDAKPRDDDYIMAVGEYTVTSTPIEPRPSLPADQLADLRARLDKGADEYATSMKIPPTVQAEADRLGVRDEILRRMYRAEYLLHFALRSPGNAPLQAALKSSLDALARDGDVGFDAVLANLLGNPHNTSSGDVLAKATWQSGREDRLIDWIGQQPVSRTIPAPLRALGGIDSDKSRTALAGALDRYGEHATNFSAAAASLARLGESSHIKTVIAKLDQPHWPAFRGSLLDTIGRMGGPDARAALLRDLERPANGEKAIALDALARIDAAAAVKVARALVEAKGKRALSALQRKAVERWLASR